MSSTPKPLILVVEDEPELAKLTAIHLEEAGMQTQLCNRSERALTFLKSNFANLLLLDVNLPDKSGFTLLEELRENDIHIPVIFVTGSAVELNKVRGLELGGDDYVTKPFSYAELIARIRAVLRRAESKADLSLTKNVAVTDQPFEFLGAEVSPERLEIRLSNGDVHKIGRKEIGILSYLKQNQGVVITRKMLIHSVWGIHANVKSRSLDQYIVKIRNLFKSAGPEPDALRTVHGVGYIFDPEGKYVDTGS